MTLKLAVTVAVDMDATAVTLKPAGILTNQNVRALIAVAQRARRMLPGFTVRLDPGLLKEVFPEALHSLTDAGVMTTPCPSRRGIQRPPAASARPGLVRVSRTMPREGAGYSIP